MTDPVPSNALSPPFTVDRYGTLAGAVTAERDWLRLEIKRLRTSPSCVTQGEA